MEVWLDIPGYEGLYAASDLGRIKSFYRGERILKLLPHNAGYWSVNLFKNKIGRRWLVHRLILLTFVGPCPAGMESRHLNGIRTDTRLINLAYGTHSENQRDHNVYSVHHNTRKTHCPRNHPYDDENTIIRDGRRFCRACSKLPHTTSRANSPIVVDTVVQRLVY